MTIPNEQALLVTVINAVKANPGILDKSLIEAVRADADLTQTDYPGDHTVRLIASMARVMAGTQHLTCTYPLPVGVKPALPARALAYSCYRGQGMHEWHRR